MQKIAIIIPCYNEEKRIKKSNIDYIISNSNVTLYFANDGSKDNTVEVINSICSKYPERCFLINFKENTGKANTIYKSFNKINSKGEFDFIGYFDADFSTSAEELILMISTLLKSKKKFIFGSRILILNSGIKRKFYRHVVGRIILTIVNFRHRLGIYDTQCGAKIFSTEIVNEVFKKPFVTKWLFDVELFIRLKKKNLLQYGKEYPVYNWRDIEGSKLGFLSSFNILRELLIIIINMKLYSFNKKNIALFISFILILVGFLFCYGFQTLNPSNINWLMSAYHDWGTHYLGWANFRNEPWHFPIGHIENYNYPAGTNVGYTDSIPLLAIFFKAFSFLLPNTFQYFGIWFLSCHLLAGYFTFKVFNLFTKNYLLVVLAVLLVSFNPVLMYRGMHPALCAQWLIVASIYYYLIKSTKENVDAINKKQIIILLLSALINPYLFLMVFGFNIILPFKNYFFDKSITLKSLFIYVFSGTFLVFVSWYIIGMVSFNGNKGMEVVNSYGLYGLNLNSFYNSSGWSSFFQQYKSYASEQYEGYSYLGLGIFILIFLGIVYLSLILLKNRFAIKKYYKLVPLLLLLIISTLFAITNKITINDILLLEFKLPDLIIKVGNVFRASGRFIWILYYTIFLFFLIVYTKIKISGKVKTFLLLIITSLQFYDMKLLLNKDLPSGNYVIKPLNEEKWIAMSANFDKIITYPLHDNNLLYTSDYQDWCYIALKNKLPITNGYVARESDDENLMFRENLKKDLEEGIISKNDFYVTTPKYIDDFSSLIYKQQVNLGYLDGYYYLYSKQNTNMANHKFELLELHKADSIFKKIKKISGIETIIKPIIEEDKIQFNIEKSTFNNNIMNIQGWAFLENISNNNRDSVLISLSNEKNSYLLKTISIERQDVAAYFNNENLNNSGFKARIFTDKMETGLYNILLGIKSNGSVVFQSANQSMIELKKEIIPLPLKTLPNSVDNIIYNIEESYQDLDSIYINGWAFISEQFAINSNIQIILESPNIIYSMDVFNVQRPDVTSHFNQNVSYDNSGFNLRVDKKKLKKGNYKIGILITINDENTLFKRTDKTILIP